MKTTLEEADFVVEQQNKRVHDLRDQLQEALVHQRMLQRARAELRVEHEQRTQKHGNVL